MISKTPIPIVLFLLLLHGGSRNTLPAQQTKPTANLKVEFQVVDSSNINSKASFRGLCVVNSKVIWASGSQGTIIRSVDGGASWSVSRIKEAAKIEFRDIEATSKDDAIVLGAGSPALVYQTSDGGQTWTQRYRNDNAKIFFDAFGFWDKDRGIAFSDPVDGRLFLLRTTDGGQSWADSQNESPNTLTHEAGFAASGTCLTTLGEDFVWVGLGGKPAEGETRFARVVYSADRGKSWLSANTTIPRSESAGIFSLVFTSPTKGIAIGGDYLQPDLAKSNLSITDDGGKSWRAPRTSYPTGYRSCIAAANNGRGVPILIATGTNGTDLSTDLGDSWSRASKSGFHAIMFVSGQKYGWATGGNGAVAQFKIVAE